MEGEEKKDRKMPEGQAAPNKQQPAWANGLKQLYDSVVDEPLPDDFKALLDKLDNNSK